MENHDSLKDTLIKVLDELSPSQVAYVLDFARFIQEKTSEKAPIILKTGSFDDLEPLIGSVSLGGDAVLDCDNPWE